MSEPSPIRDNGPYQTSEQAQVQFLAQTYGIPGTTKGLIGLVIREASLLTGVTLSPYELDAVTVENLPDIDPTFAQIIAGLIIRAHLAGVDKGKNAF